MLTPQDFEQELFQMMIEAQKGGSESVEINAGELHRRVGAYPGIDHRMANCCEVMKAHVAPGDVIVNETLSGHGAALTIRYLLPRRKKIREDGQDHDNDNVKSP